ncbi:hypothetical protein DERP_001875 [Dermatophagoides pteronyssinus]|uniref:Transmembrane protein n=1 Tax=Dermatophagoides pteronyssinus TaxID=6956 RepID=A0ABQ8JCF9_DERPT|nr:hypothetical protein DERP_001875 [Dermatophagoides pteronyssinus]
MTSTTTTTTTIGTKITPELKPMLSKSYQQCSPFNSIFLVVIILLYEYNEQQRKNDRIRILGSNTPTKTPECAFEKKSGTN